MWNYICTLSYILHSHKCVITFTRLHTSIWWRETGMLKIFIIFDLIFYCVRGFWRQILVYTLLRIQNAILTAIDSIVVPKVELAVRSINAAPFGMPLLKKSSFCMYTWFTTKFVVLTHFWYVVVVVFSVSLQRKKHSCKFLLPLLHNFTLT